MTNEQGLMIGLQFGEVATLLRCLSSVLHRGLHWRSDGVGLCGARSLRVEAMAAVAVEHGVFSWVTGGNVDGACIICFRAAFGAAGGAYLKQPWPHRAAMAFGGAGREVSEDGERQ